MIIRMKETLKFISEMRCMMPVGNFDTKFYNELNLDMILKDLLNQLDYKSIKLKMYQNKENLIAFKFRFIVGLMVYICDNPTQFIHCIYNNEKLSSFNCNLICKFIMMPRLKYFKTLTKTERSKLTQVIKKLSISFGFDELMILKNNYCSATDQILKADERVFHIGDSEF